MAMLSDEGRKLKDLLSNNVRENSVTLKERKREVNVRLELQFKITVEKHMREFFWSI